MKICIVKGFKDIPRKKEVSYPDCVSFEGVFHEAKFFKAQPNVKFIWITED